MERQIDRWCEFAIESGRNASTLEYFNLAIAIIVIGWLVSRFTSR